MGTQQNEERSVNVQISIKKCYYDMLVKRADENDRSTRKEATRILKDVLDGVLK